MNNTVKMSVKCALLLSMLGTNISLSYADTTPLPTYEEIIQEFESVKAEATTAMDKADNVVDELKKYNSTTAEQLKTEQELNKQSMDLVDKVMAEKDAKLTENKNALANIESKSAEHKTQFDLNNNKLIDTKAEFESIYNAANSEINANSKGLANNKEMVNGLQKQFTNLKDEFADYKTATNGAIAGVAAMGMLTTPTGIGHTAISAGAGYYGGETAIAVGVTHNIDALTIRAGASYSTGSRQPVLGAGVGYEF